MSQKQGILVIGFIHSCLPNQSVSFGEGQNLKLIVLHICRLKCFVNSRESHIYLVRPVHFWTLVSQDNESQHGHAIEDPHGETEIE